MFSNKFKEFWGGEKLGVTRKSYFTFEQTITRRHNALLILCSRSELRAAPCAETAQLLSSGNLRGASAPNLQNNKHSLLICSSDSVKYLLTPGMAKFYIRIAAVCTMPLRYIVYTYNINCAILTITKRKHFHVFTARTISVFYFDSYILNYNLLLYLIRLNTSTTLLALLDQLLNLNYRWVKLYIAKKDYNADKTKYQWFDGSWVSSSLVYSMKCQCLIVMVAPVANHWLSW